MAGTTKFWEIASIVLSLAQMIFYLDAMMDYDDKLEEYSDKLTEWAESDRAKYTKYRSADPSFYNYYMGLPDYDNCKTDVLRSKGISFYKYGDKLRATTKVNRGFTPLNAVMVSNSIGDDVVKNIAVERATKHCAEEGRVNTATLRRWSAIASAPVGAEGNIAVGFQPAITAALEGMKSAAHGFNSAGAMFGTSLYKLMN